MFYICRSFFVGFTVILQGKCGHIVIGANFSGQFSVKNYFTAFKLAPIAQFYKNSVIVTGMSTLICLAVMSMASYVIARFQFRGRKFLRLMFSMALLIPGSALLLPVYNTVKTIGLLDTIPGLILVYSGFGLTTSLFILSSYFMTIPRELEESAYIDGAGFFQDICGNYYASSKACAGYSRRAAVHRGME